MKKGQSSSLDEKFDSREKKLRFQNYAWQRQKRKHTEGEDVTEEKKLRDFRNRNVRKESLLILMPMKKTFFWVRFTLLQYSVGWRHLLTRCSITSCYLFSFNSSRKLWSWCILVDNLGQTERERVEVREKWEERRTFNINIQSLFKCR